MRYNFQYINMENTDPVIFPDITWPEEGDPVDKTDETFAATIVQQDGTLHVRFNWLMFPEVTLTLVKEGQWTLRQLIQAVNTVYVQSYECFEDSAHLIDLSDGIKLSDGSFVAVSAPVGWMLEDIRIPDGLSPLLHGVEKHTDGVWYLHWDT